MVRASEDAFVHSAPPPGMDWDEWEKWDAKSKEKLLAELALADKPYQAWYCKRGRKCDGQPHDEYTYKHARGDQWPPVGRDWLTWLLKGGRGSGKTRSGSEWIRYLNKTIERTSIIGPTWPHVRDTMVEGDSGLLAVFDYAKTNVLWEPSKKKITVDCKCPRPHRAGHIIQMFTGEEPERLRGPQHGAVWLDEPAHYPLIEAVWDNMMLGLRAGTDPKVLCSTTPLPIKWLIDLMADPLTVSVTVSTYENLSNLAPPFRKFILSKYEGTRMGKQELHGEILEDVEGALWNSDMIEGYRDLSALMESMDRIVIGVDPAGTSTKRRDEVGIVVVGKRGDHFYVFADYSGTYTPDGWAQKTYEAYDTYHADKIVAEKNYGGEMVLSTLRHARKNGNAELVNSRRGKELRAEPIVALYEQGRVHHVVILETLETQMTTWVPGKGSSPDRVDALVHGLTELAGAEIEESHIASPVRRGEYAGQIPYNAPSRILGYHRSETGLILPGQYR